MALLSRVLVPLDDCEVVNIGGRLYLVLDPDAYQEALTELSTKSKSRTNQDLHATILQVIRENPGLDRSGIMKKLKEEGCTVTPSVLGHQLSNLRRGNHIENLGARRIGHWVVKN